MKLSLSIPIIFLVISCGKKSGSNPSVTPPVVPSLSLVNITQARDNRLTTNYRIFINVSSTSVNAITVNYTTLDGTAVAGNEYTAKNGSLTIPANQSLVYIDVPVRGDSLREADKTFFLQLSNPVNATLSGAGKATATIECIGTYLPVDPTGYSTPLTYPGYNLVWSDEFSGTSLDNNNWTYEIGGNGWGNSELEYYTNSIKNTFVTNGGYLVIEARKENIASNNYTSARLNTAGKKEFKYGRIDIRAKLPISKGMWPALWMLGANFPAAGWPACGETDIMELIGTNPAQVVGSIHWALANGSAGTYNNNYNLSTGDFSQKFHVFTLVWALNSVKLYVDDNLYLSATNANVTSGTYPFNNPFFFIFNVAVGGNWPGNPDSTTIFPQRMIVDYIRVFQ